MASVRKLQHVLDKKVQRLVERIRNFKGADRDAVVLDHAFSAFTTGEPGRLFFFLLGIGTRSSKGRGLGLKISC